MRECVHTRMHLLACVSLICSSLSKLLSGFFEREKENSLTVSSSFLGCCKATAWGKQDNLFAQCSSSSSLRMPQLGCVLLLTHILKQNEPNVYAGLLCMHMRMLCPYSFLRIAVAVGLSSFANPHQGHVSHQGHVWLDLCLCVCMHAYVCLHAWVHAEWPEYWVEVAYELTDAGTVLP